MTSSGWMAEEYSSCGQLRAELLEEEVELTEPCRKLAGPPGEEGVVEEEEEEEEMEWTGRYQEKPNQRRSQEVLLEHWRSDSEDDQDTDDQCDANVRTFKKKKSACRYTLYHTITQKETDQGHFCSQTNVSRVSEHTELSCCSRADSSATCSLACL